jgi:hypothetical protein
MVDTWKDWTGARHIYFNLPDELGLTRISFYQREAPDSLSLFMYIVLVECRGITSKEHQVYKKHIIYSIICRSFLKYQSFIPETH